MYRYEILLVVLRQGGFRIGPACPARVSRRHFRAFLSRAHEAALFLALRVARSFPQKRIAKFVDVLKSGPSPVLDAERRSADRRKRKKGHGLEKSSPFLPNREAQLFPFRRSVPRYVDIGRSRCSKSSAPPQRVLPGSSVHCVADGRQTIPVRGKQGLGRSAFPTFWLRTARKNGFRATPGRIDCSAR